MGSYVPAYWWAAYENTDWLDTTIERLANILVQGLLGGLHCPKIYGKSYNNTGKVVPPGCIKAEGTERNV